MAPQFKAHSKHPAVTYLVRLHADIGACSTRATMPSLTAWQAYQWSHPQSQNQQIQHGDASADASAKKNEIPKSFGERLARIWDRTWDDPVAFYTFVLIAFDDFLGQRHRSGFCARWVPFITGVAEAPTGFLYDSATPPEYTRRT